MAGTELRVGLRISARYQTNKVGFDTAWYTGSVLAVNSDGSCDIAYDDGEMERGILPEHVKARAPASLCTHRILGCAPYACIGRRWRRTRFAR